MRVFVSGGANSGKSHYAQCIAKEQSAGGAALYYIATMRPADGEDAGRVERHRAERRGWGFQTVEQPFDIGEILDKCDRHGSFLLDSLTALLANEMFPPGGSIEKEAAVKIIGGLDLIFRNIENIVVVSDYIYGDAIEYDALTELYRKSLARIDRAAAARCGIVVEYAFSNAIYHKRSEAAID
jgi:adenosylcobinamide kinase/adenosylcobinamide-phosphate guanylyltransferase